MTREGCEMFKIQNFQGITLQTSQTTLEHITNKYAVIFSAQNVSKSFMMVFQIRNFTILFRKLENSVGLDVGKGDTVKPFVVVGHENVTHFWVKKGVKSAENRGNIGILDFFFAILNIVSNVGLNSFCKS